MAHDDETEGRGGGASSVGDAKRIAALEAELAAAKEEIRQNHERWIRERADLENVKKRAAREREEASKFGTERLIRDLLAVVDNLERAVEHARGGGNGQPLVDGVGLVLKAFQDALASHGVVRVESHGSRFDPAHHEAVAHIESTEHEPNSVMKEHQAGYRLHDRLLRPALVTVAKAPSRPGVAKPEDDD
jgi:molecular chaperone GrpE